MPKKRMETGNSDTRYYSKLYQRYVNEGFNEATAHGMALEATCSRAKGVGAFMIFKKIVQRILVDRGINSIRWGGYYSYVNALISAVKKDRLTYIPALKKQFIEKGLDSKVVDEITKLFGSNPRYTEFTKA
jgi:hypothetical protein